MQHGSQQLRDWLDRSKLNQREGADRLKIHYTTLNQWLSGRRVPGRQKATEIEREAGIPVVAWSTTVGKSRKRQQSQAKIGQCLQGANA